MIEKGSLVRLNEFSAVYRVAHFDERGDNAYLLPAPLEPNGAKRDRCWWPIKDLVEVPPA